MAVIDAVHSCQRSTSLMISHTRAGGAAISIDVSNVRISS
jgi:hypothetical protein